VSRSILSSPKPRAVSTADRGKRVPRTTAVLGASCLARRGSARAQSAASGSQSASFCLARARSLVPGALLSCFDRLLGRGTVPVVAVKWIIYPFGSNPPQPCVGPEHPSRGHSPRTVEMRTGAETWSDLPVLPRHAPGSQGDACTRQSPRPRDVGDPLHPAAGECCTPCTLNPPRAHPGAGSWGSAG